MKLFLKIVLADLFGFVLAPKKTFHTNEAKFYFWHDVCLCIYCAYACECVCVFVSGR